MDSSVTMVTDSDWKSWRVYVLKELERLNCNYENLRTVVEKDIAKQLEDAKTKIDYLTWRTGLFAGAVSIITTVSTVIILLLLHVKLGA
jgi:hypothetical protein